MRPILIVPILLSMFASANAQTYLTFPICRDEYQFDWRGIEKQVSKSEMDLFIRSRPKDFEAYRQKDGESFRLTTDSLYKDLHFVDLNGDGKEDVVFDGQSEGEAQMVEVFINDGNYYKKVFSVYQGVVKLDWQDGLLSRIFIRDWGCCDDYLDFHKIYQVKYDSKGMPTFYQIYQSVSIFQGAMPDSTLEKPFRFEVLNPGYNIRSAPFKDDSSFQHWDEYKKGKGDGNTIGKLTKGAKGVALAKTKDVTGREWLFVEIDEKYLPVNKIMYNGNKFPMKLTGWISSRYVKML